MKTVRIVGKWIHDSRYSGIDSDAKMMARISFLLLSLLPAGCDFGMSYQSKWIACSKSSTGKWQSADKEIHSRFNLVYTSRYKLNFDTQVVVGNDAIKLRDCSVFDANNWTCKDTTGDEVIVRKGRMLPRCGMTGICTVDVDWISRIRIIFEGAAVADEICEAYSREFDTLTKGTRGIINGVSHIFLK